MRVNGIAAEYNPFHNGHRYQLEESIRLTGAEYTIIVMSGDFVQRGAPALTDKRTRAQAALLCGADLVLELPALYATASAEAFAAGAVALFDRLGVVTHLCFGSECGDVGQLQKVAEILAKEPEAYRALLKQFLRQGLSYPDARARSLEAYAALPGSLGKGLPADASRLLSSPNNILGIDYIKALLRRKSGLIPVTVTRAGAGHHDRLPQTCPASSPFLSAGAIRQALREDGSPARLRPYLPEDSVRLLADCQAKPRFLYPEDFSSVLYYKLLTEREQGYEKYLDVSADLSRRIRENLNGFTGFEAFCDLLKTKNMTYTRISRSLLHILLGIEQRHMELGKALDYVPYARVLGLRRSAAPLLRAIKMNSSIPFVTKPAGAEKKLPGQAGSLFRLDLLASAVYMGTAYAGSGHPAPNELSTPLVVL